MKADKICRIAYFANSKQFSERSPRRKYPKDIGKLSKNVWDKFAETPKKPKFDLVFGGFKQN